MRGLYQTDQQTSHRRYSMFVATLLILLSPGNPIAQVATSITPTTGAGNLGTTVTQAGNTYNITNGTRQGTNLFHSFGTFSIGAADIANFQNNTGLFTTNILGRVTENVRSDIFGTIRTSDFGNANLFLMNPAGFLFGPTASLNVAGIVHLTTANYLRMPEGQTAGIFYADPAQPTILTSAPVAAFGFLQSNPAPIRVEGSSLQGGVGAGISFVAGDIFIGADPETGTPPFISAPAGHIDLVSVASRGEVLYPSLQSAPNIHGHSITTMGTATLTEGAFLDVSDHGFEAGGVGGTIRIRGGQLMMDTALLFSATQGDVNGAATAIDIQLASGASLNNYSAIVSQASGQGRSGNISITAESVEVAGASTITSLGMGDGKSGDISISASDSVLVHGTDGLGTFSNIESVTEGSTSVFRASDGGSISIVASSASVRDHGIIQSRTSSQGRAGDLMFAVDNLDLRSGGAIGSQAVGDGDTGNITITATDRVSIIGVPGALPPDQTQLNVRNNGNGQTGGLYVSAKDITIADEATINTQNMATTQRLELIATDSLTITNGVRISHRNQTRDAGIGPAELSASDLIISGNVEISSSTTANGDAGDLALLGQNIRVSDSSHILSRTTNESGNGGHLRIEAEGSVNISGGSTISASALTPGTGSAGPITITGSDVSFLGVGTRVLSESSSQGNGGPITITANQVQITNGAVISAKSTGTGNAGSITIQGTAGPAQSLTISGPGSGLFTETSNTGSGGDITAWSYELDLTDGATISSRTTGQMAGAGDAGNILIKADDITISGGATITAASTGTGGAGTVTIQGANSPAQSLVITGAGSGVFSDTSGTGAGGDILAISDSVLITNGGTLSAATSGTEASAVGGTIGVEATAVRIENGGLVTAASSGAANGGDIAILAEQSVTVNSQGTVSTRATGAGNAGSIGILAGGDFLSGGGSVSTTAAQGTGGDILVAAGQDIRLTDQASLSANSSGPGNAGDITALAGDDFIMVNSSITTQAAQASGGNIKIGAGDVIQITNSLVSASVQGGAGSGGNIDIDPLLVLLQNSQVRANAVLGNGGNITITTPLFFADQTSIVDASSQFGVHGTVSIQSPTSNLAGTVASLPSSMRQAQGLQTGRCAALANSQASSFLVAGRETIPTEPGGWLPSPVLMAEGPASPFAAPPSMTGARLAMADEIASLRRLTPAGFLTQHFAEAGTSGCRG